MRMGRIQKLAYGASHKMEQKYHKDKKESRKQGQPPFSHSKILHAFRQNDADRRLFRRQSEAQECDTGLMQNRMGKHQYQADKQLWYQMRRHMPKSNRQLSLPQFLRDFYVLALLQLQDFPTDQAGK